MTPELQEIREKVKKREASTYCAPDGDIGAAREEVTISILSEANERAPVLAEEVGKQENEIFNLQLKTQDLN